MLSIDNVYTRKFIDIKFFFYIHCVILKSAYGYVKIFGINCNEMWLM